MHRSPSFREALHAPHHLPRRPHDRPAGVQLPGLPRRSHAPAYGTRAGYMRKALAQLVTCDAIALLPGWPSSRGANIERSLAFEMGMKVVMVADIAAPIGRESAATLVCASTANSGLNQANELSHSDVGARSSGRHPLDHSVEVGSFEPVS